MYPRKARFTGLVHMTGRYQVYVCHIWSTARFLAFLVSAARRDVSDLASQLAGPARVVPGPGRATAAGNGRQI